MLRLHQMTKDPSIAFLVSCCSRAALCLRGAFTSLYRLSKLDRWRKPLEPTWMVVMVVVNPFLLQVATTSAYLTCFRWLASSSPVLNGTVSSTRWALELSHITMSGLSSVRATDGGKEYWAPGRSAVIDMPSGRWSVRKVLM